MSVVVTAVFHAKPGARADLIDALRTSIPDVHAERGCELFALHDADDGTVVLVEKWASIEDLGAHDEGEPVDRLRANIAPFIAAPAKVVRMSAVPAGSGAQGAL